MKEGVEATLTSILDSSGNTTKWWRINQNKKLNKSKKVVCELSLIGAPQGERNWWTKGLAWAQKGTEELGWRLDNSKECDSGREKSETSPSTQPLLFHGQEGQQN